MPLPEGVANDHRLAAPLTHSKSSVCVECYCCQPLPLTILNTELEKPPPHLYSAASAGFKTQESVVAEGGFHAKLPKFMSHS